MRNLFRMLSLATLLLAAGVWVLTGANRGWTKNSIPLKSADPVTGIEGVIYERKFVPGVDFLAASGTVAAIFAGASFLFQTRKTKSK